MSAGAIQNDLGLARFRFDESDPVEVQMRAAVHPQPFIARDSVINRPILLFDGRCSVCRRFVALMVRADRRGQLRIAPLQGSYGAAVRREYPEFTAMNTALWISGGLKPQGYSDAVLSALDYLGGPWRLLSRLAGLLPTPVRDWAYRTFAANRKYFGWFGLDELDTRSKRRLLPDEPEAPNA